MSSLLNLVEELLSLNDESLIERVVNTNDVQGCLEELCAILNDEQQAQGNDPLTLEQLREMEGDKIYIHYIDGFYSDEDGAYFGKFEQLVRECEGKLTACELPLKYYGKTWLAYRHKPEVNR